MTAPAQRSGTPPAPGPGRGPLPPPRPGHAAAALPAGARAGWHSLLGLGQRLGPGATRLATSPALRRGMLLLCGLATLLIDRYTLLERHPFALLSAYAIVAILLGRRPEGRLAVLGTVVGAVLLLPWTDTFVWELATFALFFLVLLREHGRTVQRAEAAEAARAEVEAALQLRRDFLTVAAHDLRTPLTNVLGRTQLVQTRLAQHQGRDQPLDQAWLAGQLASLLVSLRRVLGTVDEMGDLAHLEVGAAMELDRQPVDLGILVRTVVEEVPAALGGLGVSAVPIALDLPPAPVVVRADQQRLARVLQNLLSNAAKYSPRGTPVAVAVRQEGELAVVTVRDCGVGIPADELPRIFERFYRASTARGIKGSGIGLSGSKAIVEQHGGTIALASAVGRGTTVTVSLPAAAASGPSA